MGPNHNSTIAVMVVVCKRSVKHPSIPFSKQFRRLHLNWVSFSFLNAARYPHRIQVSRIPLFYKLIYATGHIVGVSLTERAWNVKMRSELGKLQLQRDAVSRIVAVDF